VRGVVLNPCKYLIPNTLATQFSAETGGLTEGEHPFPVLEAKEIRSGFCRVAPMPTRQEAARTDE
jgi:hypothetical protein